MYPIGYKVYYGDGSVYRSDEYAWEEMPDENLQVIMVYFDTEFAPGQHYRETIHGEDEYRLESQQKVKYGKWMGDEEYDELRARAFADTWEG